MYSFLSPKGKSIILSIGMAAVLINTVKAEADSIPVPQTDRRALRLTLAGSAVAWTGITLLLNEAWYKDFPRTSFHFYDDSGEWFNMDKAGHLFSSYTISLAGIELIRRTGMETRKAVWTGGLYGPLFLSSIEILDGFSKEWGFSVYDMTANLAGSALAVSQELILEQQVARIKYSYRKSGIAKYRPDVLGRNLPERMLKDYNGQTYWLSVNLNPKAARNSLFPEWLNIAVGYSANGMLGGSSNPLYINGSEAPHFERYSQFYISPDIDLSKIKTGSEFFNSMIKSLNFLKVPLPAVEYNRVDGIRFHLLF